ncbi:MAG TPA: MOSC and FAD-binding oxidoreductase domain-containing protein [Mycobacterium sp.]|jgi:ferredoxin-NADP reductase/MOSC domain-containing protein YiiM|nr:MOSC and FAD-binding oxidoreductase domain-containing protein [Mycobacterium sp.]
MARLVSVNVGKPRDISWNGRTVYTGAWKDPVDGPRMVRQLGMEGDGQGDTNGHGGPNRAVLVYQLDSYDYWRRHFSRSDIGPGAFAENLTVDGLPDTEVYIGDRYRIGEAEFEVSQPRVTCFRAGLRIGQPDLAALLVAHHRPGFYMRVITEGRVKVGDTIARIATGPRRISVAAVDALLYLPHPDLNTLRKALDIPALSVGWQSSLRQMLEAAEHPDRTPTATPTWAGFHSLTVTDVRVESPSVTSFWLTATDGTALAPARPGQYLTIRVPGARGPAIRSYSLSRESTSTAYRISVKREPHGQVSTYLHDSVHPGDQLDAAAPRGEFFLAEDGEAATAPIVLISAGVGITPMLAMLHRLAAQQSSQSVWWLHATHSPTGLAFGREARQLLDQLPAARAFTFFSAPDPAGPVPGKGVHGRLTTQTLQTLALPTDAIAYICGPDQFMSDLSAGLATCGLDPANIRTEAFGARSAINPGIVGEDTHVPHQPVGPPGTGPSITFARSGITAAFDETQKSILEFAEACDIPTRWQCRTGVCRTCETGLISGEADYDPNPLDAPTPGTALPCCARPRTDMVLDM